MKARFLLIPAAFVIAVPAQATVYLTVQQAQALMCPGATFTADFRTLTDAQVSMIEDKSDTDVLTRHLRAWKVSTGGWFIADEVVGKHDFIPFALALDAHGAVKSVEILEYREAYGGDVRNPKWLAQFTGKKNGDSIQDGDTIQNISGATLSSKHITDGVRRLLATYALVLAPH
ncbi:MAG: FMN-binding protein [Alphaproteobacteria bacterium]|nr:FMN-binding protein [Alphaproteobacteria bacterium]MDE2492536.1 FMN-binding protein [Alphaproteobacteria bacterium]